MILSDRDIIERQSFNPAFIRPFNFEQVQPASYDLTLDNELIINDLKYKDIELYILRPGTFVLGSTVEKVTIPVDLLGRVDGKSTLARKGVMIHFTAGYIDPGFCGNITLEIINLGHEAVELEYGMSIAQISYDIMYSIPMLSYGKRDNHYQNQSGVTPAWDK